MEAPLILEGGLFNDFHSTKLEGAMNQGSWGASIDNEERKERAEDALVKGVALFLCELGELHDIGCLGSKATVEYCFCLTLTKVDADCRCAHVVDFFYSGGKFVELVAIKGMAKAQAIIGLIWGKIFDARGGSFRVLEAHGPLCFVINF